MVAILLRIRSICLMAYFLLTLFPIISHCQSCRKFSAYTKRRFNDATRTKICQRDEVWTTEALTSSRGRSMDEILTPKQKDFFNSVNECDLLCICKSIDFCNQILTTIDGVLGKGTAGQLGELLKGGSGGDADITNILGNLGIGGKRRKRQAAEIFRQNLPPVVRKEYRVMTDDERNRFHNAMNQLKNTMIDGQSKFDILILYHTPQYAPGAHFGAAFLPFHRELLKFLETALRLIDPEVAIPYWDSTLDEPLPDPSHSVMWSDDFMGTPQGVVNSGPFAGWRVYDHPKAREVDSNLRLVRNVGVSQFGSLYKPEDIAQIKRTTRTFRDFSFCVEPFFEMIHGAVHLFVGGMMDPLESSPNEPTFFLLHCFVDKLWEEFRETQDPVTRETDYTPDNEACNANHFRDANMRPFQRRNVDGLSNEYTQNYYRYDDRPTCSNRCGNSAYLFCNNQLGRCVAKVRQGGNCRGLEGFDSCAGGQCVNGQCRATQPPVTRPPITRPPVIVTAPPLPRTTPFVEKFPDTTQDPFTLIVQEPTVWFPVTVQSYQNRLAKAVTGAQLRATVMGTGNVYEGEIAQNNNYPYFVGAAFAQIPNPNLQDQPIRVKLETIGRTGFPCTSLCYDAEKGYVQCEIMMDLSRDPARSTPIAYTPYKEQAPYLSWNGPERKPDKYYFLCQAGGVIPNVRELKENGVLGFKKENTRPVNPNACVNLHRCCRLWQTVGECERNPEYMNGACEASCNVCTPNVPLTKCVDRFSKCTTWARVDECKKNPIWMEENCPKSCDHCKRTLEEIKSLCGAPNRPGCDNFHLSCEKWAGRNQCRTNEWWMSENCPLACRRCQKVT